MGEKELLSIQIIYFKINLENPHHSFQLYPSTIKLVLISVISVGSWKHSTNGRIDDYHDSDDE